MRLATNFGQLNFELYCDVTPKTCDNFIKHCLSGYYNGTKFHRSIRNFMVSTFLLILTSSILKILHFSFSFLIICFLTIMRKWKLFIPMSANRTQQPSGLESLTVSLKHCFIYFFHSLYHCSIFIYLFYSLYHCSN